MFGLFKRKEKNPVKLMVSRDGLERSAQFFSKQIISLIDTRHTAYQFVLEELDAARNGNDIAKQFAINSGISPSEYHGAMSRSFEAVEGPGGPQQTILVTCSQLKDDVDQMVTLRVMIVDQVMKHFNFGRYCSEQVVSINKKLVELVNKDDASDFGQFVQMNNDLGNFVEKSGELPPETMMAYAYARRAAVAGMYAQGLVDMDLVNHVKTIFKSLQLSTCQTKEFQDIAAKDAQIFVQSYFSSMQVDLNLIGKLCHSVELGYLKPLDDDIILEPIEILSMLKNA